LLRELDAPSTVVLGANGQLGRALRQAIPHATFHDRSTFDLASADSYLDYQWLGIRIVINAAAYTAVDAAETAEGATAAWAINSLAVERLAHECRAHDITFVHVSSDYVFDGTSHSPYLETDAVAPLGEYAKSKAAGDVAAATVPQHYIVRTSWVIGEGNNFVRTMASLAERGIDPSVVNDQLGRLTFTQDLAAGILHLVSSKAPYGTYNLTNEGEPVTWAGIAQRVFALKGHDASRVTGVTTQEYFTGKEGIALRPANSVLDLAKIEATGFSPTPWEDRLTQYLTS
jgi:dTDP-4-dehydrorhamnose reductase